MTELAVVLIVAAMALVLLEAHLSTGGLIGTGSAIAAIAGVTLLLIAANAGAVVVAVVGVGLAVIAASLLTALRRRVLRAMRVRPRTGREALVGHVGVVRHAAEPELEVFLEGSLWRAEPDPIHEEIKLHDGDHVVVERVNGLTLRVRKAEEWELNP